MIFVHRCGDDYEFDLSESCLSHFFLVKARIMMIIEKKPSIAMEVCSILGRLGPNVLYSKTPPQIAAIKIDVFKMNCKVLGFITVRKGLVSANEHNILGLCKDTGEDSAHRMAGCGP